MGQHNSSIKSWTRNIALAGAFSLQGHDQEPEPPPVPAAKVTIDMATKKKLTYREYITLLQNALGEGDESGELFGKHMNYLAANKGTFRLIPRVGNNPTKLTITFNGAQKEMVHYAALLDLTFNPNIQIENAPPLTISELLTDLMGSSLHKKSEEQQAEFKRILENYEKLWAAAKKSLKQEFADNDKNTLLGQEKVPFDLFYEPLGTEIFQSILPKTDLDLHIIDPRIKQPTQVSQRTR